MALKGRSTQKMLKCRDTGKIDVWQENCRNEGCTRETFQAMRHFGRRERRNEDLFEFFLMKTFEDFF